MFDRSRRNFDNRRRQTAGAALGQYDGIGPCGMGAANDRAEIVRVLNLVEKDEKAALLIQAAQHRVVIGIGARRHISNDPLMMRTGNAIQGRALTHVVGNFALARQFEDFIDHFAAPAIGQQQALH